MKAFRVVFYKSKWFDGHKIDNIIDIWTCLVNLPYVTYKAKLNLKDIWAFIKMNYSHVEKWTPYQGMHNPRKCDWWNGEMSTSTMRDDVNGTVRRPARGVLRNPERWDATEFGVHSLNFMVAETWESIEVDYNLGYGKEDIGKFFPVVRHFVGDPKRNICSEFVNNYLVKCGVLPEFRVLSPRLLAWLLYKNLGKKFRPVRSM
jgi:hypothetical protein